MKHPVIAAIIVLFLLSSFVPAIYEIVHRDRLQPIREFELVHNFPTDFNFYLSRIRQGIEGNLTVREQYTSEPHTGSFIHVFYVFLGWLGAWSRTPWHRASDVYHVARIVFGGLLLVMISEYVKKQLSGFSFRLSDFGRSVFWSSVSYNWAVLAFLLAVTASTWPKLVFVNGWWRFGGYMPWWSVMDSLQRITFIPHLLVGQSLILFLIMAISDGATMKKPGNWIFLGVLAFALGIVFPPGLVFVIASTVVLIIFEKLIDLKGIFSLAAAAKMIPLILALPSLLYLSLMTGFYPWRRLAEFDVVKPLPFAYGEYLLAVGPILPVGLIGLLFAVWKKEKSLLPAVAWVIAWAVLLFVFHFIPSQSPLRFSEMIPHVPLAVLGSYVFYNLYNRYKNYTYYIFVVPAILIAVGLGVMYSSWLWQKDFIDHKMRAGYPLVPTGSYVMYPLKDFIGAMKYLQDATSRDTVILSGFTAGNYIPVQSGNTVYVGHANTVRAEEKEMMVKQFFSGALKQGEAKAWLEKENLRWIFFGPEEREEAKTSDLSAVYPFLAKAYANYFVTVFTVP